MPNNDKNTLFLIFDIEKKFSSFLYDQIRLTNNKVSYHHLLKPLYEKDNITQLELVKRSGLKAPTVSFSLQQMESDGLIVRMSDKEDGRSTRVFLTEEGRETERAIQEMEDKILKGFFKNLDEKKKKMLFEILSEIAENADEYKTSLQRKSYAVKR